MLNFEEKIAFLKQQLEETTPNYADSFKTDVLFYFDEFDIKNQELSFLKDIATKNEIKDWINKLTSRIVLKFDEDTEQLNDFIYDYIELG